MENNGKGIFYGVIGVATLIVAIIGATFAFFSASIDAEDDEFKGETLNLANILRNNGHKVLIEMNNKKIGKCFEYAESENIKFVMIIGDNEINTNIFKIKNMKEKIEYSFTQDELLEYLNNNN